MLLAASPRPPGWSCRTFGLGVVRPVLLLLVGDEEEEDEVLDNPLQSIPPPSGLVNPARTSDSLTATAFFSCWATAVDAATATTTSADGCGRRQCPRTGTGDGGTIRG